MLEVRLFGQFAVSRSGTEVAIASRPARSLCAYLALRAGDVVSREAVAALLWPNATTAAARNNLRQALFRVRKALGAGAIEATRETIALRAPVRVDAVELVSAPLATLDVDGLIAVLDGAAGELLPDHYDDWVLLERQRAVVSYDRGAERLLALLEDAGRLDEVIRWAHRWLETGRHPEAAYRALMRAHHRRHEVAEVHAAFDRLSQALDEDFGVDPSEQTRALYWSLVPSMERPAEPRRFELPAATTRFFGRAAELERGAELLEDRRLVTLTGPGGAGKTRLAIELAGRVARRYALGACFVGLEAVTDGDAVVEALGAALEVPAGLEVHDWLSSRQVLLVLDNLEQLAAEHRGVLVALLERCPDVSALATSRIRLDLPGEAILEVGELVRDDARALFIERARAVAVELDEQSPAIERICAAVGDLPLALELAASALYLDDLESVAGVVETAIDSLRASVEQSVRLLEPDDRDRFAALGVFPSTFSLAAATAVAGVDRPVLARLVGRSLVRRRPRGRFDLHPVLRRFALETLERDGRVDAVKRAHAEHHCRELARDWMSLVGRQQRRALLRFAADLDNVSAAWSHATATDTELAASAVRGLFHLLDRRSAFALGERLFADAAARVAGHDPETPLIDSLRARAAVFRHHLGRIDEAESELERCAARARERERVDELAFCLASLARLRYRTGRYEQARRLFAECRDLFAGIDDGWGEAAAVAGLGRIAAAADGDLERAAELQQRAIALAGAVGDESSVAAARMHLAITRASAGDYDEASHLLRESLATWTAIGNQASAATALNNLGVVYQRLGDLERAAAAQAEGLAIRRDVGDDYGVAYSLSNLGIIATERGDYRAARASLGECVAIRRRIGDQSGLAKAQLALGRVDLAEGDAAAALARFVDALGLAAEIRAVPRVAEAAVDLASALAELERGLEAGAVVAAVASHPALENDALARSRALEIPEGPRPAVLEVLEGLGVAHAGVVAELLAHP